MEKITDIGAATLDTLGQVLQDVIGFLPQMVGAILLLGLGWLVAILARVASLRLIKGLGRLTQRFGIGNQRELQVSDAVASVVAGIVYWVVILLFLSAVSGVLGLTLFTGWLDKLVTHLPNVFAGILIIFAGLVVGKLVHDTIQTAAIGVQTQQRALLSRLGQYFTFAIMIVIGVEQIGIDTTIVVIVLGIALGTLLGGIAVAFGLGARNLVGNLLAARYLGQEYQVGERVRIGDIEGAILERTALSVILDTADGRTTVPAKLFSEQTSSVLQRGASDG